jgi:UDP-N-acetylglucosamine 2-epimerase (non-hydrolysing)
VLVVIGTRPEAIKMAPVVSALRAADECDTKVALTGQHTALVDQALDVFGLDPDYDLEMMREGQTLYDVAHACLDGLPGILEDYTPDALLVQGDTATVCFGSLVGFFEDVRVGHVEAGLRSGRKRSPFPEEMFRRVADLLSDWHFAPTPGAQHNLLREGTDPASVHVTGNTVVDALQVVAGKLGEPTDPVLGEVLSSGRRVVLLTAHRRESFGEPLRRVFRSVRALVQSRDDVTVVYPVHPNPNVREAAEEVLGGHPRIVLTRPVDYLDLVLLLRDSALVLTDSGGIQEEAPTFGTPVLVMREVTERPEGVKAGVAELVGTDGALVFERAQEILDRPREAPGARRNPYGDGRAGERIADIVSATLLDRPRRTTDWAGP